MRGLLLVLLAGCGGAPSLKPEFAETAARAKGVRELRAYLGPQGTVRGLAVYHQDEALIPEPVRALGAREFPGKPVAYYESEWYADGVPVYEVEYDLGGGATGEVAARADGTLVYTERPLALDALPAALRSAALARVPGELKDAEIKQGPGIDQFEVKVEHEGRTHILVLTPAGEVVWHGLRFPAKIEVPLL